MKNLFRSSNLRTLSFLFAVILALPLSWGAFTGFYTWLSPFMMLNSVLTIKTFVWLNIIAFPVLIFVLFRKRWFCRNLCPAGWCFDRISGLNKRRTYIYDRVPDIGKWLAILSLSSGIVGLPLFLVFDPMAIFNGFFTVFSGKMHIVAILSFSGFILLLAVHLFLPGIWCAKLCPLGGLQLVTDDLKTQVNLLFRKQKPEAQFGSGRRYFLMTGLGLIAGVAIPKMLKPPPDNVIRPPATVEPILLNTICCRCGNCIKACPTGIIMPSTDYSDIPGWMTPAVSFRSGYCLETCNLCSRVCPTGAITLFSVGAKKQLFMGTAVIHLEDCLLFNNKECVKCKESCKYEALEFVAKENILNMIPVVDKNKCVGCGACEVICPSDCIEIRAITRRTTQ
jgi:ferredoxin